MNALAMQSFGFGDQLIRVFDRDGEAWFVGNDVCAALELANPRQSISRLDEDERGCVQIADAIGRDRETTIISEPGVFSLVFTSRKEAAKRFKRWVTHEVLPALRRSGSYQIPANDDVEPDYLNAETGNELDVMMRKLAVAREARVAFGPRAARLAWRELGLLPALTDQLEEQHPAKALPEALARLHPSVLDWMAARTDPAPGHRVATQDLYEDYLNWGRSQELGSQGLATLTAFGRVLTNCGVIGIKTNRMHRVGLKLLPS